MYLKMKALFSLFGLWAVSIVISESDQHLSHDETGAVPHIHDENCGHKHSHELHSSGPDEIHRFTITS
jgi:hypothetical protein